ncbi:uncharacterized protein CCOS01_09064, partial [Colletotrichum costaricense]
DTDYLDGATKRTWIELDTDRCAGAGFFKVRIVVFLNPVLPGRLKSCTWIHVEGLGYEIRRRGVLLVETISSNDLAPHEGQIFSRRFIVPRRTSLNPGVPQQHVSFSLRSITSVGRVCREGVASIRKL